MDKTFKINAYFDENGEDIEKIIARYLVNKLNINQVIKNRKIIHNIKQEIKL